MALYVGGRRGVELNSMAQTIMWELVSIKYTQIMCFNKVLLVGRSVGRCHKKAITTMVIIH